MERPLAVAHPNQITIVQNVFAADRHVIDQRAVGAAQVCNGNSVSIGAKPRVAGVTSADRSPGYRCRPRARRTSPLAGETAGRSQIQPPSASRPGPTSLRTFEKGCPDHPTGFSGQTHNSHRTGRERRPPSHILHNAYIRFTCFLCENSTYKFFIVIICTCWMSVKNAKMPESTPGGARLAIARPWPYGGRRARGSVTPVSDSAWCVVPSGKAAHLVFDSAPH